MSAPKINQHYVPGLILKNFRSPERVSVYDATRDMVRHNLLPKNVLHERYFYGKDPSVENFLSRFVETPVAPLLDQLAERNIEHNSKPSRELLRFVLVQWTRTPSFLNETLDVIEKFTGTLIRQIGELNDFPPDAIENIKVVPSDPKAIMNRLMLRSVLMTDLIQDLGQALLINETSTPYVIADHPVAHYNWYYKDSADPSRTAFTARGLQVFMPLSPSVTLCLYDKGVYKLNNNRSPIVAVNNDEDVHLLNGLQASSRADMIIFHKQESESYVRSLCVEFAAGTLHSSSAGFTAVRSVANDRLASENSVWRSQARIDRWLSFVSIRTKARASRGSVAQRDPDAVRANQQLMAYLNEIEEACANSSRDL